MKQVKFFFFHFYCILLEILPVPIRNYFTTILINRCLINIVFLPKKYA